MSRITCALIAVLFTTAAWAQMPNFDYPYFITDDDGYLVQDNRYLAPCLGDWDSDGDLDMMVGVFYYGNIYYYENVSTQTEPVFAPYVILEADGEPIAVTYG